jgi:hypothetical protein
MAAARRIRTPVDAVFLPSAALLLFLTWWVTLFPKDLERGLAFALALVPFVLMPQQGAPAGTIPGAPEVDLPRPDGQPERGG